MNKRGAELSLNVIIIAVILIVVLVVLVIIFSAKTSIFTQTTTETAKPFTAKTCDVPGTGRYCSDNCGSDSDVSSQFTGGQFDCLDKITGGSSKCCCCGRFK